MNTSTTNAPHTSGGGFAHLWVHNSNHLATGNKHYWPSWKVPSACKHIYIQLHILCNYGWLRQFNIIVYLDRVVHMHNKKCLYSARVYYTYLLYILAAQISEYSASLNSKQIYIYRWSVIFKIIQILVIIRTKSNEMKCKCTVLVNQ